MRKVNELFKKENHSFVKKGIIGNRDLEQFNYYHHASVVIDLGIL